MQHLSHHSAKPYKKLIAGLPLVLGLGACGGGDDTDGALRLHDAPVPLIVKADVVRELGIVNYFVTFGDGEARYSDRFDASARSATPKARSEVFQAKAEAQCESGTGTYDQGSRLRAFELFGVSAQVDYSVGRLNNCRRTDTPGVDSITLNGVVEQGETASGEYFYQLAGEGRTPALTTVEQDGAVFRQGVLGLTEVRLTSAVLDERQVTRYTFDHDAGSAIVGEFGVAGEPFVETDGGGRYTVNGPYRYQSTECTGGSVRVATASPVVISQGHPSAGTLRFTSGTASATVVIRSDNGATIYFSDGAIDSISGDEMRRIYDDFETECVLDRFAN